MIIYDQEPGVDRGFMPAQRSGNVCDVTKLYEIDFDATNHTQPYELLNFREFDMLRGETKRS